MKTPRELALQIEDNILNRSTESIVNIVEKALIAYGNERIEEVLDKIGFRYCRCENSEIKANVLRDEIRALKTKKEGE